MVAGEVAEEVVVEEVLEGVEVDVEAEASIARWRSKASKEGVRGMRREGSECRVWGILEVVIERLFGNWDQLVDLRELFYSLLNWNLQVLRCGIFRVGG